nr:unnamed protein product [Callosobruchus chinensis]CAH7755664.1 unnamed protein product [Callosobruchus chinensis]
MEVGEAICLCVMYRRLTRRRRRRERKYWVHPILSDRTDFSLYITLYPELRRHEEKFFNYLSMSVRSFDYLMSMIENDPKSSSILQLRISRHL